MTPLKTRLKESRLFQIAVLYAGAAWVVLEVTGTLAENLELPSWVFSAALILLLVGFFVVMATAWVQGRPGIAERAAADEVPEAWELDPRDLARSLARGRVPHLNWARAATGGGIVFLLLFGFAGMYVVIQDRGRSFLPEEATAASAPGLAILPFSVSGEGLDVWREGMVDVLSTNLDGIGGVRTINARTVLARWRESDAGMDGDLSSILRVARATGARLAVVGSAVRLSRDVRLSAELYDLESGASVGTARVEGSQDSILGLVERLSVDVVRRMLESDGARGVLPAVSTFATRSLPALQAFLEGEALYRTGDFSGAVRAYQRAVAEDSLFAMPYYRLSSAVGWTQGPGELSTAYARRARELADRLPARDAALLSASDLALGNQDRAGIEELETLRSLYPDDPEVWNELGEAYNHVGAQALIPVRAMSDAFETAIRLDSAFAPAYIHAIEAAASYRDTAKVRVLLDAFRRHTQPGDANVERLSLLESWLRGEPDVDRRIREASDDILGFLLIDLDDAHVGTEPLREVLIREGMRRRDAGVLGEAPALGSDWVASEVLHSRGKVKEARAVIERLDPASRGFRLVNLRLDGIEVSDDQLSVPLGDTPTDQTLSALLAAELGDWARAEESIAELRRVTAADTTLDARGLERRRAIGRGLDAYVAWRRSGSEESIRELQAAQASFSGPGIFAFMNRTFRRAAELALTQAGRPGPALRYALSHRADPYATFRAAQLYEELGQEEAAVSSYAAALSAWDEADADLPHPETARRRLAVLTTEGR